MPETWIEMKHPDLPDNDPVRVPETSFVNLHERKGWERFEREAEVVEVVEGSPRVHAKPKPKTSTKSKVKKATSSKSNS